jgi:rare lipoprotein A
MKTIIWLLLAAQCLGAEPERGIASYYSVKSSGSQTASGKRLRDDVPTAAHRTLPFGTFVRVTRLKTGKSIEVPITDRGPYVKGRVIDLSVAAARNLGITPKDGIAQVTVEVVRPVSKK